jgi:hypothetical protein
VKINRKELAICKRRGHEPARLSDKWRRCKWCGIWQRTLRTIEEREDDPPENEQDPIYFIESRLKAGEDADATD